MLKVKVIAKWAISGALLTLILAWALVKSSLLSPVITIQTVHFPANQSQLFFKKGGMYKETNSVISKLDPDRKTLEFTLRRYDNDLRWDALEGPGSFYVTSVKIRVLGYSQTVSMNDLTPSVQIEKTEQDTDQARFVVPEGSTDPQINIHISKKSLDTSRIVIALLLGLTAAFLFLGWLKWNEKILAFVQEDRAYTKELKAIFARENFSLAEFAKLLGIGVFLNIIPLVNFFLSVDDERGAFRTDASVWIADGRWTAFLVEKFVFPQPVMPFVPNLFFYSCLALAYMFIIRAHRLKLDWASTLAYCILVAHPIWWFIGEFYSNIPSIGFGVLMLSIAVFMFSRLQVGENSYVRIFCQVLLAGFLLSLAIGAYQSLIMFYIATGIGVIIFDYKKDNSTTTFVLKPTLGRIAMLMAMLISGVILYVVFNKIAQLAYPSSRDYIDGFLRISDLLEHPTLITKLVVMEMWKFYTGSILTYGVSFSSASIMLGLATLFLISQKTWKATLWMTLLVASMLIAPFLLNFVAGGIYLPLRAMLAVSFISWIATIIVLEKKGLIRVIGSVVGIIILFQMVSVSGQYAASTIMATTHDRLTAEAIYTRISQQNPKFDRNETVVIDVYGRLPFESRYPAPNTSTMSSSFFDWDQGNVYRMLEYMRLIGYTNVSTLPNSLRVPLTPHFDTMSIWPAEGSVRYENGIYLIKLSETPDPMHAVYKGAKAGAEAHE